MSAYRRLALIACAACIAAVAFAAAVAAELPSSRSPAPAPAQRGTEGPASSPGASVESSPAPLARTGTEGPASRAGGGGSAGGAVPRSGTEGPASSGHGADGPTGQTDALGTEGSASAASGAEGVIASNIDSPNSATLRKIRESGRIVLGYREAAMPFSYTDAQERPMGLAWSLCERVVQGLDEGVGRGGERVGTGTADQSQGAPGTAAMNTAAGDSANTQPTSSKAPQIVPVRVVDQLRMPMLAGRAIDIDCAPATINAVRERQVDFSLPYYAAHVRLMVRKGSQVHRLADMRGLRLAVVAGTTAERLARKKQSALGYQLIIERDYDEAFHMLSTGRAQAMALDDVLLAGLRANSKTPGAFKIVGPPLATEHYALVLPKGDAVFKARVDAVLADLFRNGEMAKLQKQWLQGPTPPNGVNLGFAPTPEVLEMWRKGASEGGA